MFEILTSKGAYINAKGMIYLYLKILSLINIILYKLSNFNKKNNLYSPDKNQTKDQNCLMI